ncbi:hypothetical protein HMPREF0645_2569 [Hallella bergensis DSM 17361]|uniref:Uncharacterized protein n=1 Tax=Hallella bergensis DSM 17361 TaxID=585502 RepID=D1Q034_9BACT|nr:hypothetical protein HMPREF0645_2569 [Hallella bergensis DSM 17361]
MQRYANYGAAQTFFTLFQIFRQKNLEDSSKLFTFALAITKLLQ